MAKPKGKTTKEAPAGETGAPFGIAPEERQRMISEAAYFRAAARGFRGGNPVDDWLAAEAEINRLLPPPQKQKEEQAVYQRLREDLERRFSEMTGALNKESIRTAVERTVVELREVGGYTAETVNKVAETLKKDLASTADRMGPEWKKFSAKSADVFGVWRDRGRGFLASASAAVGEWLQEAGRHLERQTYRAGEMTASGTFQCQSCGQQTILQTSAHLPPCPHCRGIEFRRMAG